MPVRKDCSRALRILTKYRHRLDENSDKSFKNAVDKLVNTLESQLFSSLMDVLEAYEVALTGDNKEFTSEQSSDLGNIHFSGSNITPDNQSFLKPMSPDQVSAKGEWEYLDITLKRDSAAVSGFGFSIAGGVDNPVTDVDHGIYVTRIASNGCADRDGRLRVDDQILTVNNISLEHVTNMEAVKTLRQAGNQLQLVVRRFVGNAGVITPDKTVTQRSPSFQSPEVMSDLEDSGSTPIWYEAQLHKPSPNSGLGFSIAGGQDVENESFPSTGIFITRISPGGLADLDGRIMPGDQLMQVNGIDLSHATHEEAVRILRNAGDIVNLVLTRQQVDSFIHKGGSIERSLSDEPTRKYRLSGNRKI
uniref:Disks large homolog 1 n=1 Tax=Schistosoma japonicum TaxID=6182 RepID=C1LFJ8_SCHJA|nr:Disks large homolog 1 [Schistosoma japonicum]